MANVLSLAMKISADATGVRQSLSPVERALQQLDSEAAKVSEVFKTFGDATAGATNAQKQFATDLGFLQSALRTGQIDAKTFTEEFKALSAAANETAKAFQEGARVTAQYRTEEEKLAAEIDRIAKLETQGAISAETAARARADLTGETARAAAAAKEAADQAAAAEKQAAATASQAEAITAKYRTDAEKRAAIEADLNEKRAAGLISEETYRRAIDDVSGATAAAAKAESDRAATIAEGQRLTAQFLTTEEKRAAELQRIDDLLRDGAITEEIAARAKAEASGANAEAARAEKLRADAAAAAARIIQANITPQERYDQQIQELQGHLDEGRLSQEQFNRAAARAKTDLDRAGAAADKAGGDIDKLTRNVSLLTKIEVGRLLIDGFQALSSVFTRVAGQVTSLATNVNAGINTLDDLSQRTGIGVEALQGYALAAKLAGVDTEQFGTAVQRLAVNIGKATPGDALDKSLKEINLSVEQLRALSPEQQFSAIGEAISELPTVSARAAAAVEIFGKQGAALAPLFREGAASIEELQDRAERLGVIVSETQVNNVTAMNDAFDLVRATVEGIAGQVIGNLAPAVTAVTEQFLEFVETWEGSQGEGGTGIANAITDVLLEGADYFAGIFDSFVSNFSGFTVTLADVGETFRFVVGIMTATSETLRAAFNVFELAGNAISMALGKLLEGIGSYVSSDLEAYGQELQRQAQEATDRNAKQLEEAASNAAGALTNAFTGGNAEAAGEGEAQKFIRGLRAGIENARLPEVKVQADLAAATEDLGQFLKTATDGTSTFLQESQGTLETFSKMAAEGELTASQIQIMNGFMKNLNAELAKEKQLRQEATDAAEKQAEADGKRVESLLKTSDAASKLSQDLAAVERERQRVAGSDERNRQARITELDELRAKLLQQQQETSQGFGEGFDKAFANTSSLIGEAQEKAKEFGQAGFNAVLQFKEGLGDLQEQVRDGELNSEQYARGVALQRRLLEERLANEKKVADERKKADEEATKLRLQQEELVNGLIQQQMVGGDQERIAAAQNLVAINAEIARAEEAQAKARATGDAEAQKAATLRLQQLDQVKAKEEDIASGVAKQREAFQQAYLKEQEEAAKAQQQQQQAIAQEQQRIMQEAQKAQAAEFDRQQKRLGELNTVGSRTVNTADVRTQEGAALVLGLAANAQDPRLIAARQANKILQTIATGLTQNLNRIGIPAVIFP
jgi:hypothetical protein